MRRSPLLCLSALLLTACLLTGCAGTSASSPESPQEPAVSQPLTPLATPAPALSERSDDAPQDLLDAYEQNQDVKGMLTIPGLDIRLPVVQAQDNDYYVRRGLNKKYAYMGTLFLDYHCPADEQFANNTIIYGHNVGKSRYDDRMFGRLTQYRNAGVFNQASIICYTALNGYTYYYQAFSVYAFPGVIGGDYFPTYTSFEEDELYNATDHRRYAAWEQFIQAQPERSEVKTDVPVAFDDRILTLVTCVYDHDNYRLAVMAKEMTLEEIDAFRAEHPDDPAFAEYDPLKTGNAPDYYLQHLPDSPYRRYYHPDEPAEPSSSESAGTTR